MDMALGLAAVQQTTEERIESLLLVIACAMTGKPPHKVAPWLTT